MTHDLSVLFPRAANIQQSLRKNFLLEIWNTCLLTLYLHKHESSPRLTLNTPNVHFKLFEKVELSEISTNVREAVRFLHSILVFRFELLLSRAETFYWQKTNFMRTLRKTLSKRKSNYLLSVQKQKGKDLLGHHMKQLNMLTTRLIRELLQVLNEKDPVLLQLFESGLLFISTVDFGQILSPSTFNSLLAPFGIEFDQKTMTRFPLNKRSFAVLVFSTFQSARPSTGGGDSINQTFDSKIAALQHRKVMMERERVSVKRKKYMDPDSEKVRRSLNPGTQSSDRVYSDPLTDSVIDLRQFKPEQNPGKHSPNLVPAEGINSHREELPNNTNQYRSDMKFNPQKQNNHEMFESPFQKNEIPPNRESVRHMKESTDFSTENMIKPIYHKILQPDRNVHSFSTQYFSPRKKIHSTRKKDQNQLQSDIIGLIAEQLDQTVTDESGYYHELEMPDSPFLPPKEHSLRFTLILDMDETMLHYPEDILLRQEQINDLKYDHFIVRPYLKEFLEEMAVLYEIVVFTSGSQNYADYILDRLEVLIGNPL